MEVLKISSKSNPISDAYTRKGTVKRVDDIPFRLC